MRRLTGIRHWAALVAIALLLGVFGWFGMNRFAQAISSQAGNRKSEPSEQAQPLTPAEAQTMERLALANTRFGFRLFSQITSQNEEPINVTISPTSVAIALAMTFNGAGGTTQEAMAQTLELQGMSLEDVNQAYSLLRDVLEQADPNVTVAIANSLWGRSDMTFRPDFLQRTQTFFDAEVSSLDFSNPDSVETINNWVNRQTQGKIPEILQSIDPLEVLFLINTAYFKGTWSTAFNPRLTSDRPFYLSDGSQISHPFMSQRGNYRYLDTDQFQAISLPYGDGRLSMYVFLPKTDSNLANFHQTLTPENWETWMSDFYPHDGHILLPRFTMDYGIQLNDVLKTMGMDIAFDPDRADFSGLSDEQLFINRVKHDTFIEVNEEGTEAAASTLVGISQTSAPIDPPFQMTVDRPFFYAIRDNQTGTILFMGSVVNPD